MLCWISPSYACNLVLSERDLICNPRFDYVGSTRGRVVSSFSLAELNKFIGRVERLSLFQTTLYPVYCVMAYILIALAWLIACTWLDISVLLGCHFVMFLHIPVVWEWLCILVLDSTRSPSFVLRKNRGCQSSSANFGSARIVTDSVLERRVRSASPSYGRQV